MFVQHQHNMALSIPLNEKIAFIDGSDSGITLTIWDPASTPHAVVIGKYLEKLISVHELAAEARGLRTSDLGRFLLMVYHGSELQDSVEYLTIRSAIPGGLPPELCDLSMEDWGTWKDTNDFRGLLTGFVYIY
jgi:hypothetical protein